jgi:hypothetical protein
LNEIKKSIKKESKGCLPLSQLFPVKLGGQLQVCNAPLEEQVPPFLHGFE